MKCQEKETETSSNYYVAYNLYNLIKIIIIIIFLSPFESRLIEKNLLNFSFVLICIVVFLKLHNYDASYVSWFEEMLKILPNSYNNKYAEKNKHQLSDEL